MIFTDLSREELLAAIARDDTRKSATELFHKPPVAAVVPLAVPAAKPEHRHFFERMQKVYRETRLRHEHKAAIARQQERPRERQAAHER